MHFLCPLLLHFYHLLWFLACKEGLRNKHAMQRKRRKMEERETDLKGTADLVHGNVGSLHAAFIDSSY